MTLRRIAKERANLQTDPLEPCFSISISDENLLHWTATVTGPVSSPYAAANFQLQIFLPETYPHIPPRITFTTPIFHPNVSSTGEVKMAQLEKQQWCPVFTVRTLLVCVQALLSDPNVEEGCILNEEAAGLYLRDKEGFGEKVRLWVMSRGV
jgi:ubiquitin-protein ligase